MPPLSDFIDKHKGEKFLVCGMGTSIDDFSLDFYLDWDGIVVGVNEITDLFEPDYHFPNQAIYPEMENSIISVFCPEKPIIYQYKSRSGHIDIEKTGLLSKRGTVAMPALTLAYQLGASEIYLIGIDFMPDSAGNIYFKDCSKEAPEYYQLADKKDPELQATLRCFQDAFTQYKAQGVKVFNLSQNSLLNDLEDIEFVSEVSKSA